MTSSPLRVLASGLMIDTTQRLTLMAREYVVPTLEGELLSLSPQGKLRLIINLLEVDRGLPFGLAQDKNDILVTTSSYELQHKLLRISPAAKIEVIADLSPVCGEYGAPFGVILAQNTPSPHEDLVGQRLRMPPAVRGASAVFDREGNSLEQNSYLVAFSPNTLESWGGLLRVQPNGTLEAVANLSAFGITLSVAAFANSWITTQSRGALVQVMPSGQVSLWLDLKQAGWGTPLVAIADGSRLLVSTNQGQILAIDHQRQPTILTDLKAQKFGIPAGLTIDRSLDPAQLIVSTNTGYVLTMAL